MEQSNQPTGLFKDDSLKKELLRFTTAGSVDDGKSTLIGRLLHDSDAIYADQLEALERDSKNRGAAEVDLALLLDALRAEREQGITIDVAYRYFSTEKRKFIIADTPGHEQYTRNMVTGASTADLAIILIDVRKGVLSQSKRHGFIASLLGIPHLIVAVNKMDLVNWSESAFQRIVDEYTEFSRKLSIRDIKFIPVSALAGDNVVRQSENMDWFSGGTVMNQLEQVTIAADRNLIDFRFPVQYVIRPHQDFRGFAGRIESGSITHGEEVLVLPSKVEAKVSGIFSGEEKLESAQEGDSVILTLDREIDISRGDMIVRKGNLPIVSDSFEAAIFWMDDEYDLSQENRYSIQQGTRLAHAFIKNLRYRINIDTLHREKVETVRFNEIARLELETSLPLCFDKYESNRNTGSFILIDHSSNKTVAAGMMVRNLDARKMDVMNPKTAIGWEQSTISLSNREQKNRHPAHVFWLTGLSGAGKSTIAKRLETQLFSEGKQVYVLDGDNIRHGLSSDLSFNADDRRENIRRIGHVAQLFYDAGFIVICAFISPEKKMRKLVRDLFPSDRFSEVYVKVSLEEAIRRDPKGLYKKALAGDIPNFTGLTAPYEEPENPEIVIDSESVSVEEAVGRVLGGLG
jgi:bifunctional enzyme CysN/CysC